MFLYEKFKDLVSFSYNKILPLACIRITLPKEMYGKFSHRDYLGGIIKLGIKKYQSSRHFDIQIELSLLTHK